MRAPDSDSDGSFPLAYLITIRTFGTWLPGDERGWTERGHRGDRGRAWVSNPRLHAASKEQFAQAPVVLDPRQRRIVEAAIREVCDYRGWELRCANVRTNHAHLVVSARVHPDRLMSDVKARATRLLREAGVVAPAAAVWARHGSARYLWDVQDLENACRYVVEGQDAIREDE